MCAKQAHHRQLGMIEFGIDHLLADQLTRLRNLRVGLVTNNVATIGLRTNQASQSLMATRIALLQAGVELVCLFAPEHGLGAAAADGDIIAHGTDPRTGLPVYSLYGDSFRPTADMLADLDLLLFDIPDVGVRFYTYIWTLSHVMEACAEIGLPLMVLDRPNPIGGDLAMAEGPMLDEAAVSSLVGRWSIPVRHSLTVGELAQLWNGERQLGVDLAVIPARGWQRVQIWSDLHHPFLPTSPSLPSFETAMIYPGTCFFEGTNLSEGRGTALPFRVVGAPWLDGVAVAERFNQRNLPGLVARCVEFTPAASKHAGQSCGGIMLHVVEARSIRPVAAGLSLLADVIALHPDDFAWLPYPTANNAPGYGHFDLLIGRLDIREKLAATAADADAHIAAWTDASGWRKRVQPYLLYG